MLGFWYQPTFDQALVEARRLANVRMQDMAVIELDGEFAIASYNKIRSKFPNHQYWDVPCLAIWHSGR